jgi:hypothetical protein
LTIHVTGKKHCPPTKIPLTEKGKFNAVNSHFHRPLDLSFSYYFPREMSAAAWFSRRS